MACTRGEEPPDATYVCMEHERVEVNMFCVNCHQNVCPFCVDRHLGSMCKLKKLIDLASGEISALSNKLEGRPKEIDPEIFEISALSNKLEERQKEIDKRIKSVNEMEVQACDELDIQLLRVDEERNRKRANLQMQRDVVTKRAKTVKVGLEKERDEIYALRLQSQTISSFYKEDYNEADLETLQKDMNKHVKAPFPHQRLLTDLRSKVDKILSSHMEPAASSLGGLLESLLFRVSKEINPRNYLSVGIELGIQSTRLDCIRMDCPNDIVEAIFKVLRMWTQLEVNSPPVNQREKMSAALRRAGEGGAADMLLEEPASEQNDMPEDVDVPEWAASASASSNMNERPPEVADIDSATSAPTSSTM